MTGIDLRIQVEGVDELMHGLERTMAAETRAEPMQRLEERVREQLETYPAPPPASTYERTGDLGRGWADGLVETDALGTNQYADQISVSMHNAVEYAEWVQDEEHQAAVHQGRWDTVQKVIADQTEPFLVDLAQTIEEAF